MAEFLGSVITNLGLQLQTKAQMGTRLTFTRVAIGNGYATKEQLKGLDALVNETLSLPITEIRKVKTGQVQIKAVLSNQGMSSGVFVREIGLFANDPDLGEILYCVANAGSTADYLPPDNGTDVVEEIININTLIGEASDVTAVISDQAFVTIDQFQEHVNDTNLHISRAEFDAAISSLRNEVQLIKATFPDSFTHNLFSKVFTNLDGVILSSGYFNEAQARLEV
ncbi:phage tail-collar fiber domain-containing protein [Brevibacillus aydinogluensis]|uniref:Phage tail protein n=1 Tax=Brevibacillus aydinogluensis TaxID=927786 RepID=A0AA48MBQ3_9BACL|nr:phage tail protein [Brevibacillus aydinogluensis]CAJ1003868.1 Phage tail protein [Brevibacillus aydinogluensis]